MYITTNVLNGGKAWPWHPLWKPCYVLFLIIPKSFFYFLKINYNSSHRKLFLRWITLLFIKIFRSLFNFISILFTKIIFGKHEKLITKISFVIDFVKWKLRSWNWYHAVKAKRSIQFFLASKIYCRKIILFDFSILIIFVLWRWHRNKIFKSIYFRKNSNILSVISSLLRVVLHYMAFYLQKIVNIFITYYVKNIIFCHNNLQ